MRPRTLGALPGVLLGALSTLFFFVSCSASEDPLFTASGGTGGSADASKGGSGSGGVSNGGSGGTSNGGSGGTSNGGSGGTSFGGSGGTSNGGSGGTSFGGSGGTSNGGSGGTSNGGSGGTSNGGSGGTSNGGSGGTSNGGSGGTSNGGSGGTSNGGSGGTSNGGSGGTSFGGSGGTSFGGSGGTSNGGSGGTSFGGSGGTSVGGSGGAPDAGPCSGQLSTVQAIAADTLPENTYVTVTGSIATSQKFQVTNACLWGVFVKDPNSNAGAFLVSQGAQSAGSCPAGTDALPQGLVPGDIVGFSGKVIHFAPTGCTGVPAVLEISIPAAEGCSASKLGTGTPPTPVAATPAALKTGTQYANQLVVISAVTLQDWPDAGAVDYQGSLLLQGSGLVVRDSIFWRIQGAPLYSSGQFFNSIVGINSQPIVANGSCGWALLPRDKCVDYNPKSADCI